MIRRETRLKPSKANNPTKQGGGIPLPHLEAEMVKCKIDDCENVAKTKGWCGKHYQRWLVNGDPLYIRTQPKGSRKTAICSVDDCSRPVHANCLCGKHQQRLYHHGSTDARRNENGAGHVHHTGYRYLKINNKAVAEHRLIAERALGKPLPAGAVVHHINGVKSDNRPSNLIVCPDEAYHNLLHTRQNQFGYEGSL